MSRIQPRHTFWWALTLFYAICLANCSWSVPSAREDNTQPYYQKIRQWQERIKTEGWTAALVDDALNHSRQMTRYEMEFEDEWRTPRQFIRAGFQGDCEDIAFFMMGTLKRLDYPFEARVLVIADVFADHAQLKVEMPDRSWKWYETTRRRSYTHIPKTWMPIVEFDERVIIYYDPSRPPLKLAIHP